MVKGLLDIGRPGPRVVLAAQAPLPQLAPLLWHSAAFVSSGGNEGAHLFEVARSLGVPAVIGVDFESLGPAGSLVVVDGATGSVTSLGAADRARRSA
jgi:phosphoenolpyruvate-protein kinase (PTS system EI component)